MDDTAIVPESAPPLVVDIDGTLTDDRRAVDPQVFPLLQGWPDTVVIATGKAMPYPVALCEFLAIEPVVIAENGGIVLIGRTETLRVEGDRAGADAVATNFRAQGYDLGWGAADLVNRWRETEVAVSKDAPLEPLTALAAEQGLVVVDTGYAYHVKSPDIDKGTGLVTVADALDRPLDAFVAIGDSENDAPMFERVGRAVAVANADDTARAAADHVTDASYSAGFVEALSWLAE